MSSLHAEEVRQRDSQMSFTAFGYDFGLMQAGGHAGNSQPWRSVFPECHCQQGQMHETAAAWLAEISWARALRRRLVGCEQAASMHFEASY